MSWLDPKNEEDEKMKNLILYKMYVTDKEMEEMGPYIIVTVIILVIIVAISRI